MVARSVYAREEMVGGNLAATCELRVRLSMSLEQESLIEMTWRRNKPPARGEVETRNTYRSRVHMVILQYSGPQEFQMHAAYNRDSL